MTHLRRRFLRLSLPTAALVLLSIAIALAWGGTGHRLINRTAVRHLPAAMSTFIADSAFYESHASDADIRRVNSDTSFYSEWPRHFIDIDDYPDFHNLPHDLATVIALYGWERVKQNGINPWVTSWLVDTLSAQLQDGNLAAARQTMSDIGHYVGDGHQPLHVTANYNGQLSGNSGIHSRYESSMVNAHQAEITIARDSARYVAAPLEFAFDYLYAANSYVDSIMLADTYAKSLSGGTINSTYYDALWQRTSGFTKAQIQRASVALASLWFTAWVDAGLGSDVDEALAAMPGSFSLSRNYPNPFNPLTRFTLTIGGRSLVRLTIYDVLGREVAAPLDAVLAPGRHELSWDAAAQPSGVYLYRLQSGSNRATGRMLLLR